MKHCGCLLAQRVRQCGVSGAKRFRFIFDGIRVTGLYMEVDIKAKHAIAFINLGKCLFLMY